MNETEHRAILEKLEPDTLRHMVVDLTAALDRLRWVPVEESMPEADVFVLAFIGN